MRINHRGGTQLLAWRSREGEVLVVTASRPTEVLSLEDVDLPGTVRAAIEQTVGPIQAKDLLTWPLMRWPALNEAFYRGSLPKSWACKVGREPDEGVALSLSGHLFMRLPAAMSQDAIEEELDYSIPKSGQAILVAAEMLGCQGLPMEWPGYSPHQWVYDESARWKWDQLVLRAGRHYNEYQLKTVGEVYGLAVKADLEWLKANGYPIPGYEGVVEAVAAVAAANGEGSLPEPKKPKKKKSKKKSKD